MTDNVTMPAPTAFVLELTNHCNLRCAMCNFHSPEVTRYREKGFMDTGLAIRLLNEMAAFRSGRPWVALHGAGESLLHKDILPILGHAGSLDLDAGFLTNGVLLKPGIAERILDTGVSWVGFSIDGVNREKFNRYRCGADYDLVVANALHFIERARQRAHPVKIKVNMTVQEEMKAEVNDFVRFWIDKADEVLISPVRPVGTRDNALARELPSVRRVPCYMLASMIVIFWNGDVGLCCEDWFNDGRIGNAASSGLNEIWEGSEFSRYRELDASGRHSEIPLCGDCNSWYNALPVISHDEELGCEVRKTAWQYSYIRAK